MQVGARHKGNNGNNEFRWNYAAQWLLELTIVLWMFKVTGGLYLMHAAMVTLDVHSYKRLLYVAILLDATLLLEMPMAD